MFCVKCGNKTEGNAKFCEHCGAPLTSAVQEVLPTQQTAVPKKHIGVAKVVLILIAVLLLFLGVGQIALMVSGKSAIGYITDIEHNQYINNDPSSADPTRYKVSYRFNAGGKLYTGSVTKNYKYGITAKSDGSVQTITIRYLPFWPYINSEDNEKSSLSGIVMIGLGLILLLAGIKGNFSTSKKM